MSAVPNEENYECDVDYQKEKAYYNKNFGELDINKAVGKLIGDIQDQSSKKFDPEELSKQFREILGIDSLANKEKLSIRYEGDNKVIFKPGNHHTELHINILREDYQKSDLSKILEEFGTYPWSTFIAQYPPYLLPEKIPGYNNKRMYEITQYSKSIAQNWPFEYKIEGDQLESFFQHYVFDKEFTVENGDYFYSKTGNIQSLDPMMTLFTGYISKVKHEYQPTVIDQFFKKNSCILAIFILMSSYQYMCIIIQQNLLNLHWNQLIYVIC